MNKVQGAHIPEVQRSFELPGLAFSSAAAKLVQRMKSAVTVAARFPVKIRVRLGTWLAISLALAALVLFVAAPCTLHAQDTAFLTSEPSIATNATQVSIPAATHGTIRLEGPWTFHTGDDPGWASPTFDDSKWDKITVGQSLAEQGIDTYSGYAWYRLRVQLQPNSQAAQTQLSLLVTPYYVGQLQVFANGVEVGRTRGMADPPSHYQAGPFTNPLPHPLPDGTIVLAIRSWAGISITHGLLNRVTIGGPDHINESFVLAQARHWDEHILASLMASFLFFCVAALAATLYLSQRHHKEYLWLALLCLAVTVRGVVETSFSLALITLPVWNFLLPWTTFLFIVTVLEFVRLFTISPWRKTVRGMQIGALLLPIMSMLHLEQAFKYLSLLAQFLFCGIVVIMLFRAWRKGSREAGVMLVPFFLAATADSIDILLDFAANRSWIPTRFASQNHQWGPVQFSTSTLTYLVFLGSLIAIILYRFIRVSEEEQRSSAEIEAARSVQALLIPTQLPSIRYFLL